MGFGVSAVPIRGEILQVGSSREIFYAPDSTRIAHFVGIDNINKGRIAGSEHHIWTVEVAGVPL